MEERRGRKAFLSRSDGLITYVEGICSYFHVELQQVIFKSLIFLNKRGLALD